MNAEAVRSLILQTFSAAGDGPLADLRISDADVSRAVFGFGIVAAEHVLGTGAGPDEIHEFVMDRYMPDEGVPAAWQIETAIRFLTLEPGIERGMSAAELFDAVLSAGVLLASGLAPEALSVLAGRAADAW